MERRTFWRRFPRIISKQNPLPKVIQLSLTGAQAEKALGPLQHLLERLGQ